DDRGDLASANLGDLLEGAAFGEQAHSLLGRARFPLDRGGGARASTKSLNCVQNLLPIEFDSALSESADVAQFIERGGLLAAEFVERDVVHDDESGNPLLPGRRAAPLAYIGAHLGIRIGVGASGNVADSGERGSLGQRC